MISKPRGARVSFKVVSAAVLCLGVFHLAATTAQAGPHRGYGYRGHGHGYNRGWVAPYRGPVYGGGFHGPRLAPRGDYRTGFYGGTYLVPPPVVPAVPVVPDYGTGFYGGFR